jgi:poly(beta-D-mannuronate) lyase
MFTRFWHSVFALVAPCILLTCFCAPSAAAIDATGLHSPWDLAPPTVTDEPYRCGPTPLIGPDLIVGPLGNEQRVSPEVKAAAYSESSTALNDLARRVETAAERFLDTGSRPAAKCVVDLLGAAATNGAMTGYVADSNLLYDQNRALRAFSIAYLEVRSSGVVTPEQAQTVVRWMEGIVRIERSAYEHEHCGPNECSLESHRGIQTASAAMAIGIAANDDSLVRWAEGRYRVAIRQIDGRGMLHYDLHGEYALKDHLESAAALIRIAELGEANGIALYPYRSGRLQLLVHTIALGLVDPKLFGSAVGREQQTPSTIEPWEVSWSVQFVQRFPDPVVVGLLHQACPDGATMWGREP